MMRLAASTLSLEQGFSSVELAGQQYGPVPLMVMFCGFPWQLIACPAIAIGVEQHEWSGMPVGAYK